MRDKESEMLQTWLEKRGQRAAHQCLISGSADFSKLDFIQLNNIKHFPKVKQLQINFPALISALGR